MNKKTIVGVDALRKFIEPLTQDHYVVGALETSPDTFEVTWQDRKTYVAQDGKEYPEEAWMTQDGRVIQIQDLTEDHAKNILRMLLRQRRESESAVAELRKLLADTFSDLEADLEPQPQSAPVVLH